MNGWDEGGGGQTEPSRQEKLPSKSPALLRLTNSLFTTSEIMHDC